MPFAAGLSTRHEARAAVAEAAEKAALAQVDLAIAFFTPEYDAATLEEELRSRLAPRHVLGCTAQGVLSNGVEVEEGPALSLWLARFPSGVRMTPFHLTLERTADGPSLFGRPDALLEPSAEPSTALVLGDPYSFPADFFLDRLNEDAPGVSVLGGMASGVSQPGEARLLGQKVYDEGASGVLIEGDAGLRSVVSQGCRPIGTHLVITRAENNVILELGGLSPYKRLSDLYQSLSPEDRTLFQNGLHIGRVVNEYSNDFKQGDFLIRNVLRLDRATGALLVGDRVRVGQTVQFQVRDAASADADLRGLLGQCVGQGPRPTGALVFTCNGRGSHLFSTADHDAATVQEVAGPLPLAGLFAAGEIGPIGGKNYVHGFTASVALFTEKTGDGAGTGSSV